eukprot:TRINITY_DN1232_c1_g1_i3.p1 TRINITY_DN1232_c1_g1~~TRINITY_DN1232_c1_g1_i3.p1  ORF type:complete len:1723 (-),score=480.39 TRINITY_DN1232_c1_g1_i3:45-4628(-)
MELSPDISSHLRLEFNQGDLVRTFRNTKRMTDRRKTSRSVYYSGASSLENTVSFDENISASTLSPKKKEELGYVRRASVSIIKRWRPQTFSSGAIVRKIIGKMYNIPHPSSLEDTVKESLYKELASKKYKVYNISSEPYDYSFFDNAIVVEYPLAIDGPPSLDMLSAVSTDISGFLKEKDSMAIIHCDGELPIRTVIVATASFIASDSSVSSVKALSLMSGSVQPYHLLPSQSRYLKYFKKLMDGDAIGPTARLHLHKIVMHGIPKFSFTGSCTPYFGITQGGKALYFSKKLYGKSGSKHDIELFCRDILLTEDVTITFYHKGLSTKMFSVSFNLQYEKTNPDGSLVFDKGELDGAHDDKKHFKAGFHIRLFFLQPSQMFEMMSKTSTRWGNSKWRKSKDVLIPGTPPMTEVAAPASRFCLPAPAVCPPPPQPSHPQGHPLLITTAPDSGSGVSLTSGLSTEDSETSVPDGPALSQRRVRGSESGKKSGRRDTIKAKRSRSVENLQRHSIVREAAVVKEERKKDKKSDKKSKKDESKVDEKSYTREKSKSRGRIERSRSSRSSKDKKIKREDVKNEQSTPKEERKASKSPIKKASSLSGKQIQPSKKEGSRESSPHSREEAKEKERGEKTSRKEMSGKDKDTKEKDSKDLKSSKDSKDFKFFKSSKDKDKDSKDLKSSKDSKDSRFFRSSKESKETKETKESVPALFATGDAPSRASSSPLPSSSPPSSPLESSHSEPQLRRRKLAVPPSEEEDGEENGMDCHFCTHPIRCGDPVISVTTEVVCHMHCLHCQTCGRIFNSLSGESRTMLFSDGLVICDLCESSFFPTCSKCFKKTKPEVTVNLENQSWHKKCFSCHRCEDSLVDRKDVVLHTDNHLLCSPCASAIGVANRRPVVMTELNNEVDGILRDDKINTFFKKHLEEVRLPMVYDFWMDAETRKHEISPIKRAESGSLILNTYFISTAPYPLPSTVRDEPFLAKNLSDPQYFDRHQLLAIKEMSNNYPEFISTHYQDYLTAIQPQIQLEDEEDEKRRKLAEEFVPPIQTEKKEEKEEKEARRQREAEERRREEAAAEEEYQRKRAEEEARRNAEAKRRAEEARKMAEEEARKAEEARRIAEEEESRRRAEEIRRRIAEEEALKRAEEEAQRKREEEAKKRAEEEARRKKEEEEAKRRAEEEAQRKREEEAKRRAEEEAQRKREEEARRKREEELRKIAEEEARRRAEEVRKMAEEARRKIAEEEARRAEEEAKRRIAREEEMRRQIAEEEARRKKAEEERRRIQQEEERRLEEIRLSTEEAIRTAEAAKRRADEVRRQEELQREEKRLALLKLQQAERMKAEANMKRRQQEEASRSNPLNPVYAVPSPVKSTDSGKLSTNSGRVDSTQDPRIQVRPLELVNPVRETTPQFYPSASLMCTWCTLSIGDGDQYVTTKNGKEVHHQCFKCQTCLVSLQNTSYLYHESTMMCGTCARLYIKKCSKCEKLIFGKQTSVGGKIYHTSCFSCSSCSQSVEGQTFFTGGDGDIFCVVCWNK